MSAFRDTLIIKSASNDFERFYNAEMEKRDVTVWTYEDMAPSEILSNPSSAKNCFLHRMRKEKWRERLRAFRRIIVFNYWGKSILLPLFLAKSHRTKLYV